MTEWTQRADWRDILPAYARCVRITRDQNTQFTVDSNKLVEPAEKELYNALLTAEGRERSGDVVADFFDVFLPMIPAVNRFFDHVLVRMRTRRSQQPFGHAAASGSPGCAGSRFLPLEGF